MARGRKRHGSRKMQLSLGSKIQWCIRSVWKKTRICLRRSGSSRLPRTVYNSDCQIMQTLSTASAAATAIQEGSRLRYTSYRESTKKTGNQQTGNTSHTNTIPRKARTRREWSGKTVIVVELGKLIPSLSIQPKMWCVTGIWRRALPGSVARAR